MPQRGDDESANARFRAGLRVGIGLAAVGLAIAPPLRRVARSWPLRSAVVGTSMRPSLDPGDWLLVDPSAFASRAPRASDLVAVPDPRQPSRWLVKRVTGVAPDGRLELAGDDPDASTDSRAFGPVDPATVIGRPWLRYWPPTRVGPIR
jgi:nickel-type superoxide dismutase maturation protease